MLKLAETAPPQSQNVLPQGLELGVSLGAFSHLGDIVREIFT